MNKLGINTILNTAPKYIIMFLLGSLGALFIMYFAYNIMPKPKKIVIINLTKIINDFVSQGVEKNLKDEDVKKYAQSIELYLGNFSIKNNLIVLPREAIISGVDDYTEQFVNYFNSELQ